jgi:hypothetical protein
MGKQKQKGKQSRERGGVTAQLASGKGRGRAHKPDAKPEPEAKRGPSKNPKAHGTWRAADVPWGPKKVAVIKALQGLKATSAAPVTLAAVAEASGLTSQVCRHYLYHAMAGGLVGMVEAESGPSRFYRTPKGQKVDPAKALAAQLAQAEAKEGGAK